MIASHEILKGQIVNAFHIDGNMILLATTKGCMVLDEEYKSISMLIYEVYLVFFIVPGASKFIKCFYSFVFLVFHKLG